MTTSTHIESPRLRRLMTLSETAEALRKSDSQLRWLIHERKAPPFAKIGGRILFDADGVADWLDSQFEDAPA